MPEERAPGELVSLTLITVALSILAHGISVKPLMSRFLRHRTKNH
jgi:sodium/hydrogen antiporter